MFTVAVETTYTDPMKVNDEFPKHQLAATEKLGTCWMTGSQTTSIPHVNDAGVPTDNHDYKLTTYWQAGVKPGTEPEPAAEA
jgi:hypothetical protein